MAMIERKGSPLDNNKIYNAPARRKRTLQKLQKLFETNPDVLHAGDYRILFRDKTKMTVDPTGRVITTGGAAARAKFAHRLL